MPVLQKGKLGELIIEGLDGDSTRVRMTVREVCLHSPDGPTAQPQIVVRHARVKQIEGGISPDSVLGMVARAGAAKLDAATAMLGRKQTYRVEMASGSMRSYTSASGQFYQHGTVAYIDNPVEVEEMRAMQQFKVLPVYAGTQPNSVDGQLEEIMDQFQRLVEHAEAIRLDPAHATDVMEKARVKGELFARALRAKADAIEERIRAAHAALVGEATGGTK